MMTEQEWLASTDPARILRWWVGTGKQGEPCQRHPTASPRKLRLFACACCRQSKVWDRLVDEVACCRCRGSGQVPSGVYEMPAEVCGDCSGEGRINRSRRAVEVAEQYADGLATNQERHRAWDSAIFETNGLVFAAARCADDDEHIHLAPAIVCKTVIEVGVSTATQAALLRCIAGNPWRPVTLPMRRIEVKADVEGGYPAGYREVCPWLTHNDGAVLKLARIAYEQWDWSLLPLIADALEEAGCPSYGGYHEERRTSELQTGLLSGSLGKAVVGTSSSVNRQGSDTGHSGADSKTAQAKEVNPILVHLRGPGPHARGCHVIDALLGKE